MSKKQMTANSAMPDPRTIIICEGIESEIYWLMIKLMKRYTSKDAAALRTYKQFYPLAFKDAYLRINRRLQLKQTAEMERRDAEKERNSRVKNNQTIQVSKMR